jgi:DNA binding domain, excisionase family
MTLMICERFLQIAEEVLIAGLGKYLAYCALMGEHVMEESNKTTSFQLLLTIPEVAKALSLGRTKVYELIWKEDLPVLKFGRAVRVSKEELQRWLEMRSQNS